MLDSEEAVNKKINKAECIAGNSNNGLMAFLKYVVFVIKEDKKEKLSIERPFKYGGNSEYHNYPEIESDFVNKKLHPLDLKKAVAKEINKLIEPVRSSEKLNKLYKEAYK